MDREISNKLFEELPRTSFVILRNPKLRKQFNKFCALQTSVSTYAVLVVVLTLAVVSLAYRLYSVLGVDRSYQTTVFAILLFSFAVAGMFFYWPLLIVKVYAHSPNKSFSFKLLEKCSGWLQSFLMFGMAIVIALHLIFRVVNGQCTKLGFNHTALCNPNQDVGGLPYDSVALLMMLPLAFNTVMRDSNFATILWTFIIALTAIIVSSKLVNGSQQMDSLVGIYAILGGMLLYENQRQNLQLFVLAEKLTHSLEENERLADETHATELRHMIANVAHDLKTVSF
jgi:hypothetical protein